MIVCCFSSLFADFGVILYVVDCCVLWLLGCYCLIVLLYMIFIWFMFAYYGVLEFRCLLIVLECGFGWCLCILIFGLYLVVGLGFG